MVSCKSPQATKNEPSESIGRLATIEQEMNQSVAEHVKKIVKNHQSVTKVHAVNTYDSLVVAFELRPFARFRTHQISEQIKKQINHLYPMFEAIVTTDQKIVWELKKTEKKIKDEKTTINDIQLDIKRIIKLAKDNV